MMYNNRFSPQRYDFLYRKKEMHFFSCIFARNVHLFWCRYLAEVHFKRCIVYSLAYFYLYGKP